MFSQQNASQNCLSQSTYGLLRSFSPHLTLRDNACKRSASLGARNSDTPTLRDLCLLFAIWHEARFGFPICTIPTIRSFRGHSRTKQLRKLHTPIRTLRHASKRKRLTPGQRARAPPKPFIGRHFHGGERSACSRHISTYSSSNITPGRATNAS